MLWNLAPGRDRKPFDIHGLTLPEPFFRSVQDPLVHHGRHFGRVVHCFCNIQTLLTNGIALMGERADELEESLTAT